ncbi:MAG: exodeoxyribonuclease III [Bacteroidales bacterium]|jgi:exodeoxyribonuclease-3|nr:exodeoxyribonuclease III [Bacteroidales bacterium]
MKIISLNVNGIRASINKGLFNFVQTQNPDVICFQETKAQPEQIDIQKFSELGYSPFINSAIKKGYSGTAIFSKINSINSKINFDNVFDNEIFIDNFGNVMNEGRILTLEYDKFYLITTYVPNAKPDLSRLKLRENIWDKKLLEYIKYLEQTKPIVICGDFNVAHKEIDLANPKQNEKNAGFTVEEREGMTNFLNNGLIDIFRYFYPEKVQYTWWSMRTGARERNIGWRIDYFLTSQKLCDKMTKVEILDNINLSDHCPILLEINL